MYFKNAKYVWKQMTKNFIVTVIQWHHGFKNK